MITNKQRLLTDIPLFAAFLAASSPAVTGFATHEWLAIGLAVPTLVHLVVNWSWVTRVAATFLRKLLSVSRLNFVVDAALFVSTVTVMLSGIMVSRIVLPTLGLSTAPTVIWHTVHAASATSTLALLLTHFGLHLGWVARTVRTFVPERTGQVPAYKEVA